MKTSMRWHSDQWYIAELTCLSLDPISVRVEFTNSANQFTSEVWNKDSEDIKDRWKHPDKRPNMDFADAMTEALQYFIHMETDNKIDDIILSSCTESNNT